MQQRLLLLQLQLLLVVVKELEQLVVVLVAMVDDLMMLDSIQLFLVALEVAAVEGELDEHHRKDEKLLHHRVSA